MKMTNDNLGKGPLNVIAAWGMMVLGVLGLVALLFSTAVPSPAMVTITFMASIVFFFAWMGLGSGAPWLLNFVIGHDGEMAATIDGWDTGSRKSCSQPTVQHVPPLMSAPHSLCLDKTQQQHLPPGKVVRLLGQVSFLGVTAERIEW